MIKGNCKSLLFSLSLVFAIGIVGYGQEKVDSTNGYSPQYESLLNYTAPEWYEDAKLGFWVHWGVYSVPAFSGDHAAEWYGRWMYCKEGQSENNRGLATHNHHIATYGDPSVFGYKDFIPMFKAEKFNADEWASYFVKGGAKFFCMMGAHHDNFAMWATKLSRFNAAQMGPKQDLVGAIEKAVRAKGLKFGVSNHSGWNSGFFQWNIINGYDAKDTTYQDLYGNPIIKDNKALPSERDLNRWLARTEELCDMYKPDLYYFDWDINGGAFESRRKEFAAHYYNKGIEWGDGKLGTPGVVLNYKTKAFPYGAAVLDHERGRENTIPPIVWQTDDCVYDGSNWSYVEKTPIKSPNTIIDELVDIVSKRGVLMLSFGPKADGTFPENQKQLMFTIGDWLKINGEAIYSTRPWTDFGEGPSVENKGKRQPYTAADIRFTRNKAKTILYATLLDWTDGEITIKSLDSATVNKNDIQKISLIGSKEKLSWSINADGLTIQKLKKPMYDYAFPIKIEFKNQIPDKKVNHAVADFQFIDLGTSTKAGSVKIDKDEIEITASGKDIWDKHDEGSFAYKKLQGDFDFIVQAESLKGANLYTKAGIMARADLSDSSQHVFFQLFTDNKPRHNNNCGSEFQYREVKGGGMKAIYPDSLTAGSKFDINYPNTWIRMKRNGDVFTTYISKDNKTWNEYTSFTLKLPNELYVGLVITSHDSGKFATAKFSVN